MSDALQKFRAKYPGYDDMSDQELATKLVTKHPEYRDILGDIATGQPLAKVDNRGIVGQAWDALKVPEQKSREGLKIIADAVPMKEPGSKIYENDENSPRYGQWITPPPISDAIVNSPKIAAETLAEVAPGFVSRGAIVGGALAGGTSKIMEALSPAARVVAGEAEKQSGLIYKGKNLLTEAFKSPTLMAGPGREAANAIYSDIQSGGQQIGQTLKSTAQPLKFVQKAIGLARNGGLGTDEALAARQELDSIKDSVTGVFYRSARSILDPIAKQDYSGADKAYQTAVKSEALRSFSSFNKNGTPSVVRNAISILNPKTALLYTPAIQAGIASALGALYKGATTIPTAGATAITGIAENISRLMNKNKESSNGRK